jgi:hypothetical protein
MLARVFFEGLSKRYPHKDWRAVRTICAWVVIDLVLINWPVSMFTYASEEPPLILSLSWLALLIEAISLLTASQVHEETGTENADSA